MDRNEVMGRLQPLLALRPHGVTHGSRTRVVIEPEQERVTLRHGSALHEFAPDGVKSLMHFTGMPERTATRLEPATLQRALTELLEHKEQYTLLSRDDRVVELTPSGQYRRLDASRVLDIVERHIPSANYGRVTLLGGTARVEITGERQEAVRVGDLVQAGVAIGFSPIWAADPTVQSFAMRLICTNGATAPEVERSFTFGGEGDSVWQWFRRSIREAYASFGRVVNRYREMDAATIAPDERAPVLEGLLRRAGMRGEIAETVRAWALEAPPDTEWDALNLITWASSHLLDNPRAIVRAQQAISQYTGEATHRQVCPVCRRTR